MMTNRDWSDAYAVAEKIRNAIAVPVTRQDDLFVMLVTGLQAVREERDAAQASAVFANECNARQMGRLRTVAAERNGLRASLAGLDELRRLSEAATSGELISEGYEAQDGHYVVAVGSQWIANFGREEDADFYIAAVTYVRSVLALDRPIK